MKKIILAFIAVFIINLSCKKEQRLCGCSPVEAPAIYLSITNTSGVDLLNTSNTGSFSPNSIQLFTLGPNGSTKTIGFIIRPPFSYGNNKFEAYQIYSPQLFAAAQTQNTVFYLKLGNQPNHEMKITIDQTTRKVDKLMFDQKEALKENSTLANYVQSLFYITL